MKRLLILGTALAVAAAIGCRTNDGDQQAAGTPPYTPPAADTATVATATTAPVTTPTPAPATTQTADLSPRATNAPPAAPAAMTPETAPRIGAEEAAQRVATGQALVVDVRTADAYKENHIPGAINIPYDQLKTRAGELPKDKYLVTYCT